MSEGGRTADPRRWTPAAVGASLRALLAVLLLVGCQAEAEAPIEPAPPDPAIVIPLGVVSTQTAQQVVQKMLAEIATNEQKLGHALAPPRISWRLATGLGQRPASAR
jgi:hypothetical protein